VITKKNTTTCKSKREGEVSTAKLHSKKAEEHLWEAQMAAVE